MNFFRTLTSVTRWLLVVFGCAVLATAQPMSAASTDTPPPRADNTVIYPKNSPDRPASLPGKTESGSGTQALLLIMALALAAGGAYLLIQRKKNGPLASRVQRKLTIEETRPLGNRQYLVVACYEKKKFLLGVAPGQIQLLTPLDDAPPAAEEKS